MHQIVQPGLQQMRSDSATPPQQRNAVPPVSTRNDDRSPPSTCRLSLRYLASLSCRNPYLRRAGERLYRSLPGYARISQPDSRNLHSRPSVGFIVLPSFTTSKTGHRRVRKTRAAALPRLNKRPSSPPSLHPPPPTQPQHKSLNASKTKHARYQLIQRHRPRVTLAYKKRAGAVHRLLPPIANARPAITSLMRSGSSALPSSSECRADATRAGPRW